MSLQVVDGTFTEEPGSGAVATIENKRVSVGTVDWVQRCVNRFLGILYCVLRILLMKIYEIWSSTHFLLQFT